MKTVRNVISAVGAGAIGVGMTLAMPGAAGADEAGCIIGTSNTEPSCETHSATMNPVPTMGEDVCAGVVRPTTIRSFDGPLEENYDAAYPGAGGMAHGVKMDMVQGISPLGEWGSTVLNCDYTAIVDWHNLDTGDSGTASTFVPADQPSTVQNMVAAETGPGQVELTVRTDQPSIPASTEIFVP